MSALSDFLLKIILGGGLPSAEHCMETFSPSRTVIEGSIESSVMFGEPA